MAHSRRILLIDDEEYAGHWVKKLAETKGFGFYQCFSEIQARREFEAVANGDTHYSLALVDLMVPTHTFDEILEWNDGVRKNAMTTGFRLCTYARIKLGIPEVRLPILAISSRSDEDTKKRFRDIGVPFIERTKIEKIREHILRF